MSYIERLSIQQRRGKRVNSFQDKTHEQQSLRETLMQRANKVKDKIAQQTNNFDFSVQKLMNQTLREVKKHKLQFQQKHQDIAFIYQGEQYESKKTILKQELHKKLQICKNKYKEKIVLIKNRKGRFYKSNSKSNQQQITIEDMLKTAKNKFKFQQKDNKKERNKSEIIHLKKINQQEIINFVHRNYPGHCALKFKSNQKFEHENISIDMVKLRENKNLQSSVSMQRVKQDDISPQKLNATEIISFHSQESKKSLYQHLKNKRKLFPSGYPKTHQTQNSNVQNISNSQRSIFIPMGKVALSNERKRMITEFQVTNSNKKERYQNRTNKLSSQIVAQFVEIQLQQKNEKESEGKIFLPLNKKLKTQASIQLKQSNHIKTQNLSPIRASRLENEQLNCEILPQDETNLLKSYQFQNLTPKSKCFQNQQEKSEEKQLIEIRCFININDLKVECNNEKQIEKKRNDVKVSQSNSGLKSILYNRKANQLSRKIMKNHMNSRGYPKRQLLTQSSFNQDTNSKNMLLDIKGSNMHLQNSLKIQNMIKKQ